MISSQMDADVARVAAALPRLDIADISQARLVNDALLAPLHAALSYEGVRVTRIAVPSDDGSAAASLRLMRPVDAGAATPVLLAMHGGGFVLGRSEDFDYFCLEAVRRLGITVANVDYRLAPETVFPGPLDDCVAALRFVHAQASELGIDPTRIAVGGSSAGGCLAAATVLRARDEGGPAVAFQLLLSPATDDRWRDPAPTGDMPFEGDRTTELVWESYLGPDYDGPEDEKVSAYAVPARAEDLSGLPSTYIAAMESDPIRDSNIEYARRLLRAGVRVELHCHPGTFHGSAELAPQAASSARVIDGLVEALGRGLSVDAP
ncbi:alpha/beta hydrolase [Microbacterium sp. NPDC091313]